jgi:hypothetical protein
VVVEMGKRGSKLGQSTPSPESVRNVDSGIRR